MSGAVQIRPALPADAAAVAELGARTFRETFERDNDPADMTAYLGEAFLLETVHAEIADPASTFLLAFAAPDGPPIGYAQLKRGAADPAVEGPAPIEIARLYAAREAIGKGVGAALMRDCLARAARGGYRTIWLGVWERNERAIAFYRRWGFETVGSHPFMLGADRQIDLIMTRAIEAGCC